MASLIESLITVLVDQNSNYKELLKLSKEKTEIIIKGNTEKLREMISYEQQYLDKVTNLEKKRIEIVNDIAIVLNKDVEYLTVKEIVKLLEGQKKEQRELSQARDDLNRTLKDMVKINDMNKRLINDSLEMINFNINLINSFKQFPEMANYSKDANNVSAAPGLGAFDAKQ